MNNEFVTYAITGFARLKQQALSWANQFNICCFLDSNNYPHQYKSYECIAGVGALELIEASSGNALQKLKEFQQQHKGWLFGHLGYELKSEIEALSSSHPDFINFPDLFFFVPQVILLLNENELVISSRSTMSTRQIFDAITSTELNENEIYAPTNIDFTERFSKAEYVTTIELLKERIHRGDCYEINFCQDFFASSAKIDPLKVYKLLIEVSPVPFAAYYKINDKYLLCASPERFMKKVGNTIIAQPIKGTGKRNLADKKRDDENKTKLFGSSKDRSENIMVVDLVRNDLSKVCVEGTVVVEELFGIYSFPQVHQMISTICGQLKDDIDFAEIIRNTFPMGSMTGAPKKKVMEIIEENEKISRGIFSGAVGYISEAGDFDFNVVIRSILYNSSSQYISYLVGSGITFYSNAEEEYEECLLKAKAIKQVL